MTDTHKITEELLNALDEYTAGCTVVIASEDPHVPHGSGVAVIYGGKQYILTAAHVVSNESDNQRIRIIGKPDAPLQLQESKRKLEEAIAHGTSTSKFSSATPVRIVGRLHNDNDDLAALEVESLQAYLPHTLLHDLSSQQDTQVTVEQTVTIFGFPGMLAKHYENQETGKSGWAAFPHATMQSVKDISVAPKSKDPKINFITDFDYTKEERLDPHGMSGCGAWSIPDATKGELWSASKTQLLGIQIAYDRSSNVLVFVKIDRVLRLLSSA